MACKSHVYFMGESWLEKIDTDDKTTIIKKMQAKGFTCDGRLIPISIKPYFLPLNSFAKFSVICGSLSGVLEKITGYYLNNYNFDGLINIDDELLKTLVKINPGYRCNQVIKRMDLFYDQVTGEIKFNEFNCSDPTGIGWHDALADILLSSHTFCSLKEKYDIKVYTLLNKHFSVLLNKYHEFCATKNISPKKKPVCAIACHKDYITSSDFGIIADYYNNFGINTFFVDTCSFEYDGEKLTHNGEVVDIVYRDSMLDFIRGDLWPKARCVMDAYKDGNICLVNPVSSIIGGQKTVMAILTDPKYFNLFEPMEVEMAVKHIPWTRCLGEYKTDLHGKPINLIPYVLKNKDFYVLKPADGYGGKGVFIGQETTDEDWYNTIDEVVKLKRRYCVQEYVKTQEGEFLVLDVKNGKHDLVKRNVGLGFWVFDHELAGVHVRFSSSKVINVSSGGGLALGCFVNNNGKLLRRLRSM